MASNPPEWQVGPPHQRPRTLWSDVARLWGWIRGLPILAQLVLALLLVYVVFKVLSSLFGGSGGGTTVASRSTSTLRRTSVPATTTTAKPGPPLPAGEDRTVKSVIDGDSFELTDGIKIRLIGIDAPDVETSACFSSEATSHLKELLRADKSVRIVYDTTRTDRFGRTLAYVYRLPDGLFINVAMVRDGFARDQAGGSNTAHANDIATALSDARAASRGLWQACASTTTAGGADRSTTTTEASTTTTTEPSSTTSSTVASATTSTLPPGTTVVEQGAPCLSLGATAVFANGSPAVCTITADEPVPPRWRPA
jgi:micrococcal nuclease